MKRIYHLVLSVLLVAVANAEEPPIRYAFQVFQLNGGFTQETSLSKKIWQKDQSAWDEIKSEVVLFDRAEFRLGKDKLTLNPKRCVWNDQELTFEKGHETKLPESKIKMIYSPNLIRKEKELVRLKIESNQPYQFMTKRDDGLYALQKIKLPTGMDLEIKAQRGNEENVYDVDYLEIEVRSVNARAKAAGTRLPVGKPVLSESEYILKLQVKEYRSYGILLQPKGMDGFIIIRFEVDDLPQ